MASWQFHSLIFSRYIENHDIPEAYKRIFLLGCFAPDLVSRQRDKKETHLGVGVSRMPLFFQMRTHRAKCTQDMADPDMLWFYKGYLLHMETDACWIRHCMHPFALKYLMSGGKWKDTGTAYYDDMIEVDKYYRSKYAEYQSEAEVMELLQDTQEPAFLPEMLLFSMIERVKELLLATHTSRKDVIRTKYLDEKRVHTFFEKICAVVV